MMANCLDLSISIHALREEGDIDLHGAARIVMEFLSTPSARRATIAGKEWGFSLAISIHALREEGDMRARLCE